MNESNAVAPAGVLIREPRESEFAACRVLLPEACAHPAQRVFRLAFDAGSTSILGALSYIDDGQGISAVQLHVVKSRRQKGIGSILLGYAMEEARRLGRSRVLVDVDLKKAPVAEQFLTARGFRITARLTSVHGPILGRGPKREQFHARVAGAGDLPPESRIINIAEAPFDQILELHAQYISNTPMAAAILRTFRAEQYPESVAVMAGEKVIGFLLAQVAGDTVRVPALVVLPEYRGKRLAIRMIAAMEDRLGSSVQRAEFEFAESAVFTAKLASEFGHEIARIAVRFEHPL